MIWTNGQGAYVQWSLKSYNCIVTERPSAKVNYVMNDVLKI